MSQEVEVDDESLQLHIQAIRRLLALRERSHKGDFESIATVLKSRIKDWLVSLFVWL